MPEILALLLQHGPAGILAIALIHLYREKTAAEKEHAAEIAKLQELRRTEMEAMKDRYIVKSESYASQLASIVEGVREFLVKVNQKAERKRSPTRSGGNDPRT